MEKAAKLQSQIRENSTELTDFLKDLTRWEENVKYEDKNLKTARKLEEKIPPVRTKVKKPNIVPAKKKGVTEKPKGNSERISSYDYDAWSKFDADAACKSDSAEENDDDGESEEEEEVNAGEIERIRHEQLLQKAIMEKEKGNQLFKEGKYEAAINRYTSAITCDPSNPVLYANRAMAQIKTERYAAAEQDCDLALQLDPSYGKAIARRGTARKKLKKYNEALEDFTHLCELEPKNQQAIQEIKDIKKLLVATKETLTKETIKKSDVATSQSKTIVKEPVHQRRRSNKPLKRIHITEVGIDEPTRDKIGTTRPKNDRVPQVAPQAPESIDSPELSIPTTSFIFETEFKRLKNDGETLYSYLKLIPLSDYGKLFYQCIDNLISTFISIIKDYYIRDNLPYHEEMKRFSDIKRFEMAIMFLSRKDKETLGFVINNLSSDSYKYPVEEEFIKTLAKKYNVKL